MNKNEKQIMFWVCGGLLIVGVLLGVVLGYYALPHITYIITTQPGVYTFDIGPTAATIFSEIYGPKNYTSNYTSATTKVIVRESIPLPDTQWEEVPSEYYALDNTIANNSLSEAYKDIKAVPWEQTNPKVIINTNCYQPVICPCAKNTTQPCMLACYEWVNKTGC